MSDLKHYNLTQLETLSKVLRQGDVSCLVGAGTSIACGYPGWHSFLHQLRQAALRITSEKALKNMSEMNIKTQIDRISSLLKRDFRRVFFQTFKPIEGLGERAPEWIRLIFDLNIKILMTTNYTVELEQVARFHPSIPLGPKPEIIRWHDQMRFSNALRHISGRPSLIYLHGRYNDDPSLQVMPDGTEWSRVVLGERSYRYAFECPGLIKRRLEAVLLTSTLLIIGASMNDEDITGTFRTIRAISSNNAASHYAILPLLPSQSPEQCVSDFAERYNIQPIFYEVTIENSGSENHNNIEYLLHDIVRRSVEKSKRFKSPRQTEVVLRGDKFPSVCIIHSLLKAREFVARPLYRKALDDFSRKRSGGVLALIGIGGAGKTAIVREFLDDNLETNTRPWDGLFVWSFYDNADSCAFFQRLAEYLGDSTLGIDVNEIQAYEEVRTRWPQDARLLCVLDGLERLQLERPNDRCLHGTLESTVLREFLLWLAQSTSPGRAIITTRFPLPDLEPEIPAGRARVLELDFLTRHQARTLLRRRGVKGSDRELNELLDHFGAHALTVDHLGGVIRTYLQGDATRFGELGEGSLTRFEVGQAGKKLARVLSAYEGYLKRIEPDVQETLRQIAVFHRPPDLETLVSISLRKQQETTRRVGKLTKPRGSYLRKVIPRVARHESTYRDIEKRVRFCIRRLTELRLIRQSYESNQCVYSIHPAIRDSVLTALGTEKVVFAVAARQQAEDALNRITGRPGVYIEDTEALNLSEDVIGFYVEEGEVDRAIALYDERLGGYDHLGWKLGQYMRGERIVRQTLVGLEKAKLPSYQRRCFALKQDLAIYLADLGRLRESVGTYRENADSALNLDLDSFQLVESLYLYSDSEMLAGSVERAKHAAGSALAQIDAKSSPEECQMAYGAMAWSVFNLGDIIRGFEYFERVLEHQRRRAIFSRFLVALWGFRFQLALLKVDKVVEALEQAKLNLSHENKSLPVFNCRSLVVGAEAHRRLGNTEEAKDNLLRVQEWAMSSRHKEMLLWTRLIRSRVLADLREFAEAYEEAREGLRVAQVCHYGLFNIDFRNALSRISIGLGDFECAFEHASAALSLASFEYCGYFWGELEALSALAVIRGNKGKSKPSRQHSSRLRVLQSRTEVKSKSLDRILKESAADVRTRLGTKKD
jgi:tetratricopeptide (TPR) repeat protein